MIEIKLKEEYTHVSKETNKFNINRFDEGIHTLASVQGIDGQIIKEARINHSRGNIVKFLGQWDKGSPVAIGTIGNWYWISDADGFCPSANEAEEPDSFCDR